LQQYEKDVFSLWSVPRGYLEDIWGDPGSSRAVLGQFSRREFTEEDSAVYLRLFKSLSDRERILSDSHGKFVM
jgi:hypothetical protein